MKILSLIIATTLFIGGCDVRKKDKAAKVNDNTPAGMDMPTTVQLIDSVFDFGQITEGENVEFSYRFKNTGSNALIISHVSASCGCTVPEKPEQPIKPGEIGYIKVKFNSENRPGEVHKTVSVLSNASPAFPELSVQGEVIGKQ